MTGLTSFDTKGGNPIATTPSATRTPNSRRTIDVAQQVSGINWDRCAERQNSVIGQVIHDVARMTLNALNMSVELEEDLVLVGRVHPDEAIISHVISVDTTKDESPLWSPRPSVCR
jgi:hypothetical protein